MTVQVRSVPSADTQAEVADDWWRKNRPSVPDLFASELRAATELLVQSPDVGRVFAIESYAICGASCSR